MSYPSGIRLSSSNKFEVDGIVCGVTELDSSLFVVCIDSETISAFKSKEVTVAEQLTEENFNHRTISRHAR